MWPSRGVVIFFVFYMSVDSRGVIGSIDETYSECPACSKGLCRSINGIYTRENLPPGYSLVAQIPKGACRIAVQQMKHSRNFIALKKANGTFLINGDWKFSTTSRSFEGAGTRFAYVKQDRASLESITSEGQLEEPLEIYLVSYQPNLGIKYGYLLPNDIGRQLAPPSIRVPNHLQYPVVGRQIAPPSILHPNAGPSNSETRKNDRSVHFNQQDDPKSSLNHHHHRQRRVRRRFSWKISGISACSKSCGGGIQTTVVSCVRELTQTPVSDKRCAHLDKPNANPIRCNIQDCPPKWSGYWSSCSVTCGTGIQRYLIHCKQELNTGREVLVDDAQCSGRPKPKFKTRTCTEIACDNINNNEIPRTPDFRSSSAEGRWLVGDWSECSVTCGTGHRSRSVTCTSGECRPDNRPSHAEYCSLPKCAPQPLSQNPTQKTEISPWLVSEWSQCSENCGTGKQTRYAVCGKDTCDISSKPESARDCSSERQCGGQWFAGPWDECSDSCSGSAHQNRDVICIVKLKGQLRITNEMTCPNHLKPPNVQPCSGKCDPYWFTGDWSHCENCPNGIQRRTVRCMDVNGLPSNKCLENDIPASKKSCDCHQRDEKDKYRPALDQPIDQNCVDKIRNCYLAVQARLCQYEYYKSQCCTACRKAQQDQHLIQ
ncbi:hypothetical protein WA026_002378 [Henosepilachna vigintioctopunctata]|uniref:PLAC domain-containing protein n=1 Tax=Henosepilachna vigintioctopunctata TaxID=420089 RepID=A0AAW1TTC5_9CUCU